MKRILFVEDNSLLREVYGALAGTDGAGWEVLTAPDGAGRDARRAVSRGRAGGFWGDPRRAGGLFAGTLGVAGADRRGSWRFIMRREKAHIRRSAR
ncbi:MAG TPA: hypothetical protein VGY56_16035 [Verrucomicrobiae bacterium]|nr:hypothetical protein [Verrucomicrobiae bacterium]